jgi:hypothetical protein
VRGGGQLSPLVRSSKTRVQYIIEHSILTLGEILRSDHSDGERYPSGLCGRKRNNGIETVVEQKDGNLLNLTPEMHDLVNNAISASFGLQVNDSGQFELEVEYIIILLTL